MSELINLLKTYTPKWVAIPIVLLLSIPVGMNYLPLGDDQLPGQIKAIIQPILTTKIMATSILLFLSIASCYILLCKAFYRKPNMKNYTYNPVGYYVNKKTKEQVCPRCLKTRYIEAPLCVAGGALRCSICDKLIL